MTSKRDTASISEVDMGLSQGISSAVSGVVLTAPRLQLRWVINTGKKRFEADDANFAKLMGQKPKPPTPEWLCHYELVLPLGEHDIRREVYGPRGGRRPDRTEIAVPIKPPTVRGSESTPCTVLNTGKRYADEPIRDGPHARWDSALLGGLPIYVIAPDGMAFAIADTCDRPTQVPGRPQDKADQ